MEKNNTHVLYVEHTIGPISPVAPFDPLNPGIPCIPLGPIGPMGPYVNMYIYAYKIAVIITNCVSW